MRLIQNRAQPHWARKGHGTHGRVPTDEDAHNDEAHEANNEDHRVEPVVPGSCGSSSLQPRRSRVSRQSSHTPSAWYAGSTLCSDGHLAPRPRQSSLAVTVSCLPRQQPTCLRALKALQNCDQGRHCKLVTRRRLFDRSSM